MTKRARAPSGDLNQYDRDRYTHGGGAHDVYRRGSGPAVIVVTEMPGISTQVVGFADRLVAMGLTAVLPDLFDNAQAPQLREARLPSKLFSVATLARVCVRREFTAFALGKSSPVVDWLRALAAQEHRACGGPGVGVVSMCFTGGFALAMATEPAVLAPVLSQPSLPIVLGSRGAGAIDTSSEDLARVRTRCEREGLRVLGLRFLDDPFVPDARFALLRERLGDAFVAVELPQSAGHPEGPMPHRHCVLTQDLIDEPREPTRAALEQVLTMLRAKLLTPSSATPREV